MGAGRPDRDAAHSGRTPLHLTVTPLINRQKYAAPLEPRVLRCVRSPMSFASDALRDEAARFRRMKFMIDDARTLRVIEEYALELEARAALIDLRNREDETDE